jgi:hypothetical protein
MRGHVYDLQSIHLKSGSFSTVDWAWMSLPLLLSLLCVRLTLNVANAVVPYIVIITMVVRACTEVWRLN